MQQSNQSIMLQHSQVWSKLWKLRTIPKHVHLMWRILHDRIPVRLALFNIGIQCSPLCCFYNERNETVEHLFMDCEWVRSVWLASHLGVNFSCNNSYAESFLDWLELETYYY